MNERDINTVTRFSYPTNCSQRLENISITVRRCNALPFIQLRNPLCREKCSNLPQVSVGEHAAVTLHISDIYGGNFTYPYAFGRATPWGQVALIELDTSCWMPNVSVVLENVSITFWAGSLDMLYPNDYDGEEPTSPFLFVELRDEWEVISLLVTQSQMIIHQSVRPRSDAKHAVFQFLVSAKAPSRVFPLSLSVTISTTVVQLHVIVNGDQESRSTEVNTAIVFFSVVPHVEFGWSSSINNTSNPSSVLRIEGSSTIVAESHVLNMLQQNVSMDAAVFYIGSPGLYSDYSRTGNVTVRGMLINISVGCSIKLSGSAEVAAVAIRRLTGVTDIAIVVSGIQCVINVNSSISTLQDIRSASLVQISVLSLSSSFISVTNISAVMRVVSGVAAGSAGSLSAVTNQLVLANCETTSQFTILAKSCLFTSLLQDGFAGMMKGLLGVSMLALASAIVAATGKLNDASIEIVDAAVSASHSTSLYPKSMLLFFSAASSNVAILTTESAANVNVVIHNTSLFVVKDELLEPSDGGNPLAESSYCSTSAVYAATNPIQTLLAIVGNVIPLLVGTSSSKIVQSPTLSNATIMLTLASIVRVSQVSAVTQWSLVYDGFVVVSETTRHANIAIADSSFSSPPASSLGDELAAAAVVAPFNSTWDEGVEIRIASSTMRGSLLLALGNCSMENVTVSATNVTLEAPTTYTSVIERPSGDSNWYVSPWSPTSITVDDSRMIGFSALMSTMFSSLDGDRCAPYTASQSTLDLTKTTWNGDHCFPRRRLFNDDDRDAATTKSLCLDVTIDTYCDDGDSHTASLEVQAAVVGMTALGEASAGSVGAVAVIATGVLSMMFQQAGLAVSPSSIAAMRSALVASRLRARCDAASSNSDNAVNDATQPSSIIDSPTQLWIELRSVNGGDVGAVVGNTAVVVALGTLRHIGGHFSPRVLARLRELEPHLPHLMYDVLVAFVQHVLGHSMLPATLVPYYALLLQPSVAALTSLMISMHVAVSTARPSGGVWAIVAVGAAAWVVVPLGCVGYMHSKGCWASLRVSSAHTRPVRPVRHAPSWLQVLTRMLEATKCTWRGQGAAGKRSSARFGALYEPYRPEMRAYWLLEAFLVMTCGALQAAAEGVDATNACAAALWGPATLAAVGALQLALLLSLRPMNATVDTAANGALTVLALGGEVAAAAGWNTLSSGFALATLVLQLVLLALAVVAVELLRRSTLRAIGSAMHHNVFSASLFRSSAHRTQHVAQRRKAINLMRLGRSDNDGFASSGGVSLVAGAPTAEQRAVLLQLLLVITAKTGDRGRRVRRGLS